MPQRLAQCLAPSRHSGNIYGMNVYHLMKGEQLTDSLPSLALVPLPKTKQVVTQGLQELKG